MKLVISELNPGQTFSELTHFFNVHFPLKGITSDAQEMILTLTYANVDHENVEYRRSFESRHSHVNLNEFLDKASSLLLLRSADIAATRNHTFMSYQESLFTKPHFRGISEEITTSEVSLSLYTLPCDIMMFPGSLENINDDDIRYVTVFDCDKQFLNAQGITSITGLHNYLSKNNPTDQQIKDSWSRLLEDGNTPYSEKYIDYLTRITSLRMFLWQNQCEKVIIPIMNILKS